MIDDSIVLPSKPKIIKEDDRQGVYEIDGLYPGYGHTLGNSLRRIILSSLPGVAITSFKIEGVTHEFSTLAGVKEDVIMLILNLKKVRFQMSDTGPYTFQLKIKGAKTVTAKDIDTGGHAVVLNPELLIATVTDKKTPFDIEFTVQKGLGYLPKEMLAKGDQTIGTIYVDGVFTPVRRASYEVENMRVGDRTDYNRLRLNIETDGTISPRETLETAITIMINQLKAVVGFREDEVEFSATETPASRSTPETAGAGETVTATKTPIEDLDLSPRVLKALSGEGVRTVAGLTRKSEADLRAVDGLGEKAIEDIKEALGKLGVQLKS